MSYDLIHWVLDKMNPLVSSRPYRALEWCDEENMPRAIRQCCQNMLLQNWNRRLPWIQMQSPAKTACVRLEIIVNDVAIYDEIPLNVIDFCAGSGGPTPIFEGLINGNRTRDGLAPLQFVLSDLWPNITAWEEHSKKSDNLTYIEQSVDAAHPPPIALSVNSPRGVSYADTKHDPEEKPAGCSPNRIFRLFNLSFHHLGDEEARRVLRSTLVNADGIAIIELQDRRLGCMLLMALNIFLVLLVTPFWFSPFRRQRRWQNVVHLLLTYSGILPVVLCWDGLASCLRTREFEEVMASIGEIEGVTPRITYDCENETVDKYCEINEWTFTWRRQMHTFPFGYVNWITGVRKPDSRRLDSMQATAGSSTSPSNADSNRSQSSASSGLKVE
ncbi:hypothetical protein K505DRAFT_260219 [Melanomma pulvis-pyrius CBS 109.77]|uniref:Uncharacterized protein n=1 Tax=Melanomma pulvis-pyrius CBS 109.77 TaxID=1314802 RepID=A0A6A6WQN1_9PLEO|nr:hypothetical protein K505DRAFT_260219 [Melanomma pulvis-pyrius CBS 109.77]